MRLHGKPGASGARRRARARTVGWLLLWTLVVCYPNPLIFFRNFWRYAHFPVDPSIIDRIRFSVPREPRRIEDAVMQGIPYEFDWRQYGVPWYVPTAAEVVRSGRGDCESRAVVLASLFQARGIPYRLQASLVHIWVDYPGKKPSETENSQIAIMRREKGRYRFRLPDLVRLREDSLVEKQALWDLMPPVRKLLLLVGWMTLLAAPWLTRRSRSPVSPRLTSADMMHEAAAGGTE